LVLVTGGAGTGKSTTLAAIIDRLNHTRRAHVITLEDPIEYAFVNDTCVIEQREIGVDAPSFASALRHVVRQIPDIIMIGEMRDLDTIAAALTAAETGHLVFATLHTMSAAQTVERIVDVFDSRQQPYVRTQLATCLQAVVCQTLFANELHGGRVPATEVMVRTPGIARAIRDNEVHLIPGMIETGRQQGMHTLDTSIADLVARGLICRDVALTRACDPEQMQKRISRLGMATERPTAGRQAASTPSATSWR
jgi:twitching motility protein PilT